MQIFRLLLQIVIFVVGCIGLAVLLFSPNPNYLNTFGFIGFIVLLLALTQLLKEQTESRIYSNLITSSRPLGVVLIVLGIFGVFHGISYFIGTEPLPNGSGNCRAICGLILLTTASFGEVAGLVFAGFLWSAIGLMLSFFGFKVVLNVSR